eukprot:maker-scaffold_11-snap-gene-3.5-mRNA-1 protein AED:0.21 eAED:0.21 QI:12/1/1/1/1/1/3/66/665
MKESKSQPNFEAEFSDEDALKARIEEIDSEIISAQEKIIAPYLNPKRLLESCRRYKELEKTRQRIIEMQSTLAGFEDNLSLLMQKINNLHVESKRLKSDLKSSTEVNLYVSHYVSNLDLGNDAMESLRLEEVSSPEFSYAIIEFDRVLENLKNHSPVVFDQVSLPAFAEVGFLETYLPKLDALKRTTCQRIKDFFFASLFSFQIRNGLLKIDSTKVLIFLRKHAPHIYSELLNLYKEKYSKFYLDTLNKLVNLLITLPTSYSLHLNKDNLYLKPKLESFTHGQHTSNREICFQFLNRLVANEIIPINKVSEILNLYNEVYPVETLLFVYCFKTLSIMTNEIKFVSKFWPKDVVSDVLEQVLIQIVLKLPEHLVSLAKDSDDLTSFFLVEGFVTSYVSAIEAHHLFNTAKEKIFSVLSEKTKIIMEGVAAKVQLDNFDMSENKYEITSTQSSQYSDLCFELFKPLEELLSLGNSREESFPNSIVIEGVKENLNQLERSYLEAIEALTSDAKAKKIILNSRNESICYINNLGATLYDQSQQLVLPNFEYIRNSFTLWIEKYVEEEFEAVFKEFASWTSVDEVDIASSVKFVKNFNASYKSKLDLTKMTISSHFIKNVSVTEIWDHFMTFFLLKFSAFSDKLKQVSPEASDSLVTVKHIFDYVRKTKS